MKSFNSKHLISNTPMKIQEHYRVSYRIFSWGGGGGRERCRVWVNWDRRVYFFAGHTLMKIAIEGPDLNEVNFNEILDIFKEKKKAH